MRQKVGKRLPWSNIQQIVYLNNRQTGQLSSGGGGDDGGGIAILGFRDLQLLFFLARSLACPAHSNLSLSRYENVRVLFITKSFKNNLNFGEKIFPLALH